MTKKHQRTTQKENYEIPTIDIIKISREDVITTSGKGDENQGKWDPQSIDVLQIS